jgi:hypothetical protein
MFGVMLLQIITTKLIMNAADGRTYSLITNSSLENWRSDTDAVCCSPGSAEKRSRPFEVEEDFLNDADNNCND